MEKFHKFKLNQWACGNPPGTVMTVSSGVLANLVARKCGEVVKDDGLSVKRMANAPRNKSLATQRQE